MICTRFVTRTVLLKKSANKTSTLPLSFMHKGVLKAFQNQLLVMSYELNKTHFTLSEQTVSVNILF